MIGLRGRMVLVVMATSLATLATAILAFSPFLERRLENDRLGALRDLVRTAQPALRLSSVSDRRELADLAAHLQRRAGGRIVILGSDGRVLADTAPAIDRATPVLNDLEQDRAAALARREHVLAGVRARLAYAATDVQALHGRLTLVIAKPLDDTRAAVSVVRSALPFSLTAGLVVATLLALLLSYSLLRRLRRLVVDADQLGTSGLQHPISVKGRDEITTVAKALESMRSRLAAEEAARVAFLATASHELRTPLASLQATLELLREEAGDARHADHTTVERADTALRQTHRLVGLATDLLELSRVDTSREPQTEPVDLREIADAISREFRARSAASGRALEVTGERVTATANTADVARIVAILLDNATSYGAGSVRVAIRQIDGNAEISVEDEGDGVDPSERERVFARFERGHASAGSSGAGLGLAIARGLAEAMGGSLDVVGGSRLNRFLLLLPVAQSDQQEMTTNH